MASEPSYRNILQDTLALLREIEAHYSPAALSNGFGPESMVLTDLIHRHDLTIDDGDYGSVLNRFLALGLEPITPGQRPDGRGHRDRRRYYPSYHRESRLIGPRSIRT